MIALKMVAQAQELSPKYLEQLAISLRHAGLVLAERGSQGGYMLAKPPEEITALEIVQAVDGPLQLVSCVNRPASCHRSAGCAAHGLWSRLTNSIGHTLSTTTLAELRQEQGAGL